MKNTSILRVGTTEGRFRMVMPQLIAEFAAVRPDVSLRGVIGNAEELRTQLENGQIDLAFSGISPLAPACIGKELLFDERLYLVVSDDMLRAHFGSGYADCLATFEHGADLARFAGMPFCRSLSHLHCMQILDRLLESRNIALDFVHTSAHFDLHQHLAKANYAACFCLSMYIPHLKRLNADGVNPLHLFPIEGLAETNPVYLLRNTERAMPDGAEAFARLLRAHCAELEQKS